MRSVGPCCQTSLKPLLDSLHESFLELVGNYVFVQICILFEAFLGLQVFVLLLRVHAVVCGLRGARDMFCASAYRAGCHFLNFDAHLHVLRLQALQFVIALDARHLQVLGDVHWGFGLVLVAFGDALEVFLQRLLVK